MISFQDEWVVSRIFHKNTDVKKTPIPGLLRMNSIGDDLLDCSSLPPLMDPHPSYGNSTNRPAGYSGDEFKGITNPLSSSSKSPSDGYYLPSLVNNHHQILIKPEDHRNNYENPTNSNYHSNQASFSYNQMGNNNTHSSSQPQIRVQNPSTPFQQNLFSDYRMNSSWPSVAAGSSGFGINNNHSHHDILRAIAAKNNEYVSGLDKQCKMEQFSCNQSVVSVSQDTGLSNDRNTDTSSVVSKQDMGGNRALYEDLEGPSSVAPLSDLECLWDDY